MSWNGRLATGLMCAGIAIFITACAAPPKPADPEAKDPAAKDPVAKDPVAKDPVAKDPKVVPGEAGAGSFELKYDPRPRKKEASKTAVAKTGEMPKTATKSSGTADVGSPGITQSVVKVVVLKEMPKRSVIDHTLQGIDPVSMHIDVDLNAIAFAGSPKAVADAIEKLKPLGLVESSPSPRIRTGPTSLYAVYLKNIGSDKVTRFVRELLNARVEILVRPNSGAIIFEGEPEAVALAASLALQLDGQSADFGSAPRSVEPEKKADPEKKAEHKKDGH